MKASRDQGEGHRLWFCSSAGNSDMLRSRIATSLWEENFCGNKIKGGPGEEGEGEDPHPARVPPILWSVRHGRAAIYPIHSSLGGHSSIPLFRGWPRGSPTWEPQSYFAKATRVIGERDEGRGSQH